MQNTLQSTKTFATKTFATRPFTTRPFATRPFATKTSAPLLLALVLAGCVSAHKPAANGHLALGGHAPEVRDEAELRAFLDDLEAQEFLVSIGLGLEEYNQWRGNSPHFVAEFTRFSNDIHSRRDYAVVIDQWHGKVNDPMLARRLELHHRDFLQARADPAMVHALSDAQVELQDTVDAFRFDVGGEKLTMTAVTEKLRLNADRAVRRAAFMASTQSGAAHADAIVACMKLNDQIARAEGFPNGAEAGLVMQGLTRAQAIHDLEAFEESTRPVLESMIAQAKRDLKVDELQPWDIDYWLYLQETAGGSDAWPRDAGVTRMKDLMTAIGFEPEKMPIDVGVRDVPVGGIAFPVRPPFEAWLLTNPFSGSDFYETLFHEYGHTLNGVLIDAKLPPALLTLDEGPMSEGIAETLGHFAYDAHWLARAAGVTPERATQLERVGKMQLLLWLRRSICLNAHFEALAYDGLASRSNADLDALYAQSYKRFMRMDLPNGRFFGSRDMLGTSATYFDSYLYANMVATQLREAMRKEFGVSDLSNDKRVGPWMVKHLFAPGASIAWQEKVREATGKPLDTQALAKYLDLR